MKGLQSGIKNSFDGNVAGKIGNEMQKPVS